MKRLLYFYLRICFCILVITAFAKIISSFGDASVLYVRDPLFLMPYRSLMLIVGSAELTAAMLILSSLPLDKKLMIVSLLSVMMITYRLGLWWIGWTGICPCLGNATALIDIGPKTWEIILKLTLGFLLVSIPGVFFARSLNKQC